MRTFHATALVVSVALIACGPTRKPEPIAPATASDDAAPSASDASSASSTSNAPAEDPATPGARPVEGGDMLWKDMTKKQHVEFMKKHVRPTMKAAFIAFDAKKYEKFDCTTCHGDGALDSTYKMPNPQLPKLDFSPEVWPAFKKKHAAAIDFMKDTVSPKMAEMLGLPHYSPDNPSGFGCMNCHTGPR